MVRALSSHERGHRFESCVTHQIFVSKKKTMEEELQNELHPRVPKAGRVLHTWTIPVYQLHTRGTLWYIIAGTLVIALLGYAVATANFLFALLIILFAVIIFLSHTNEPPMVDVAVTDLGIVMNERFYPYHALTSFWIIFDPPLTKHLYIQFQSSVRPALSIHLADENPLEIRETLRQFVYEDLEKREEPLSEVLWRVFKM